MYIMFVEILLFVGLLVCAFEYFVRHDRIGKLVSKFPGAPVWPILGNLWDLIGTPEQIWKVLRSWDVKYYPTYRIWTTHKAIIIVLHPDDIEKVFTSSKHSQKSFFYYPLLAWLGNGLLTSFGAKWQKRRKMLTPAFHFNILKQYSESMAEHGGKTMESLKSRGETVCNVNKLVADYTLRVICETAMGYKFDDEEFMQKYRNGIHYIGYCTIYRITNPWFAPESIFRLTPRGQKYKKYLDILHDFTKKILKERKEYHEETKGRFLNEFSQNESKSTSNDEVYSEYGKKRLAMLDLLIAMQKEHGSIDDQGIQEEVDTFTFEGHDTTAMSLGYAILLIAEHKDVQERIRQEVNEVLDKNGGKMGMAEIQSLTYLEMCLKESLRLYPIAPYLSRTITEDIQLSKYLVPKGTVIQVHTYSVHRAPEFWPDPEKFNPDRFLPEIASKRHPYTYIPFSAGPRNCIGQKFAMMELKAFIGLLVYNFYLEPVSTTKTISFIADVILRTTEPIRVKLVPIKK